MKKKKVISVIATSLVLGGAIFCGYKYRRTLLDALSDIREDLKQYLDLDNDDDDIR